jgi:hypothetical protein
MPGRHSIGTIVSVAVLSMGLAALSHEGLGHAVTAWVRGDTVTELTSNHVSTVRPDRLVDAGGTIVNLVTGSLCLWLSFRAGRRANLRYFLWFFGAMNLLQGTGYFLFSGILGLGDWAALIEGMPHQALLRIGMAIFGGVTYLLSVRWIARGVGPFLASRAEYNRVGKLGYLAACCFYCVAGAFDPLGVKLLFLSTVPAAFGGASGLVWADSYLPVAVPEEPLAIQPSRPLWAAAAVFGLAFVVVMGRGLTFGH